MPRATWPRLTSSAIGLVVGVLVAPRVGLHRLEPLEGGRVAVGAGDRGDDGLEVGFVAARAILPFHCGWASCMAEVGSWLGLMSEVL